MPTIDRKPRRRIGGDARKAFTNERDARAAADAVCALPEAQHEEAWRRLLPAIRRWIMQSWSAPVQHDDPWLDRVARAVYLDARHRVPLGPTTD